MASNITLSAAVRQNLLSLQSTAQLMSTTQNRLATGKKVNSALDNPSSFFTSQSLSNRAGDLNSLLDSIGQAQQTLKAADQGLSSLTKMVESMKSIAKQARQAAQPGAAGFAAVTATGNPTDEALGTFTAGAAMNAATVAGTDDIDIAVTVGGTTTNINIDTALIVGQDDTGVVAAIQSAIDGSAVGASKIAVSTDNTGNGTITMAALDADVDFTITANATTAEIGLTTSAVANRAVTSTSLLDSIGSAGQTLDISVSGGATQQITFGNAAGQVSTLAELQTKIGTLSGVTGSADNTAVSLTVASSSSQNSLKLTASNAATITALGLGSYAATGAGTTTNGTAYSTSPNTSRTSLQSDYNDVVAQLDTLASDASYNGVNLLNGDDLKVVFNENGTSSLTISGVTFDAAGLGLSSISGTGFQSDSNIDAEISKLDTALATLRNQGSKFGSNLTTVQTRQEFTKNLVNTLQTGADNLVLADTNEEGANMLALQTRQQLSSTALALSAQADQAVLRLF